MSKEIDWCNLPNSPCTCQVSTRSRSSCGIVRFLKEFHGQSRKQMKEELLDWAENDPDRFFRTCEDNLYPSYDRGGGIGEVIQEF